MIKKEILIGFVVGLLANAIGFIIAILIFGDGADVTTAFKQSLAQGFFSKLVSMGAVLNLIVFFLFIKQKRDYGARGVILATVVVTIATFLVNYK